MILFWSITGYRQKPSSEIGIVMKIKDIQNKDEYAMVRRVAKDDFQ